jgi:endonuclease-3
LSKRLGFSKHEDPNKVEVDLCELLPSHLWAKAHQLLIWHGRRTCFARNPACERCVVNALCPKIGVKKTRALARPPHRVRPLVHRVRPSAASSASE